MASTERSGAGQRAYELFERTTGTDEASPGLRIVDAYLEELKALAAEHPGDEAVHEAVALTLRRAVMEEMAEGRPEGVGAHLDTLEDLVEAYPENPRIRAARLSARLFAAFKLSGAGHPPDVVGSNLEELDALIANHGDDPEVARLLNSTLAGCGLLAIQEDYGELSEKFSTRLDRVETDSDDGGGELTPELHAQELVDDIAEAFVEDDVKACRSAVERLASVADDNPDNPLVQRFSASGLVRAAQVAAAGDDRERLQTRVQRLRTLAEDHPDDPVVRSAELAGEAIAAGAADEFEVMRSRLNDLDELYDSHGDDKGVRLSVAAALGAGFNYERVAGNEGAADSIEDRIRELVEEYPRDSEFRGVLTMVEDFRGDGSSAPTPGSSGGSDPSGLLGQLGWVVRYEAGRLGPARFARGFVSLETGLLAGLAAGWARSSGSTTALQVVVGVAALVVAVAGVGTYSHYYAGGSPDDDDAPWARFVAFAVAAAVGVVGYPFVAGLL